VGERCHLLWGLIEVGNLKIYRRFLSRFPGDCFFEEAEHGTVR
jgi:hypothetical protein